MFGINLGDLGPPMPLPLVDADQGGAVVVLNADTDTAVLDYVDPSGMAHSKSLTITSPSSGICEASWVSGDLPNVGTYRGKVRVARTGDATFPRSYPNDGTYFLWTTYAAPPGT